MEHSLIIFDYSGSMAGDRYKTCREVCMKFKDPFELWLFGSGIERRGVVSQMPEFACNSGTDITKMLNALYDWMAVNQNKYVYLLTDGEAQYDEQYFRNKFASVVSRNHQVTVYDICGTNVEPLKRIFTDFGIQVVTELVEVQKLFENIQITMKIDQEIIKETASIDSRVGELIRNFESLAVKATELKQVGVKLQAKSKIAISSAEKALVEKANDLLTQAANDLKQHLDEIAEHLRKLKKNENEAKRLELNLESIKDDKEELETKLQTERNSGNLTNPTKINNYLMRLNELTDKEYKLKGQINTLKGESSAMIKRMKELQTKTYEYQSKVTAALA